MTLFTGLLRAGALPDFLIIGAQKAGTTSLASYLAAHPCVVSPTLKEVHFFDLNYSKGIDWYRSHFPISRWKRMRRRLRGKPLLTGDATPYYLFHPRVPFLASQVIPSTRIIVLLRDPVDRAYSHYHHEVRLGKEKLSFEDAIEAEPSRTAGEEQRLESEPSYESLAYQHFTYLARGIYSDQMHRWMNYYRPEQFQVLSSEQFFESPATEYRKVLKFLGLRDCELPAYPADNSGKYASMSAATRDRLLEYYAPHNRKLRQHLNSLWPRSGDAIVDRFAS